MFRTDIERLLLSLANERRLFWSEADFQFALAWKIQQKYPNAKIRLERRQENTNSKKPAYVDIWVELNNKIYPIELLHRLLEKCGANVSNFGGHKKKDLVKCLKISNLQGLSCASGGNRRTERV